MTETLKAAYAALQAERERDWAPEQLRANAATRAALVRDYNPRHHAQVGELVDDFTLTAEDGTAIRRDDLIAHGPAVLIFYRFGGCPACNVALPRYDRSLSPVLARAGIPLVAVSPQAPVDPALRARHGLSLTLASDPNNALGDWLGITFTPQDTPAIAPGQSWIGSITGTGTWVLPQPTVLVLDRAAQVRFIAVSPDWMDRPEPEAILAALPEAGIAAAA
ncbi:peroxiredoxin-like family protein [Sphingomonas sp. H39-1-10]|uniref:peroxiredoxin-like family protein n=1 Tax=Sphingomonas pollutisoli TaxID=3030829 RepID=UPI0023B936FE|nr:peroxiredoxin-like family protein [Sphingomonas pollutisoli]MDF0489389.1 peroxiredoxin-like family protein [Sphingomonas pollutisoli]